MARLVKSRNKWIDGVLGGLGNYFEINPDLLRITFLILLIILDVEMLIPAYILMMIIMPSARKTERNDDGEVQDGQQTREFPEVREERRYNRSRGLQIIGVILILFGLSVLIRELFPGLWYNIDHFWYNVQHFFRISRETVVALLLILGGVWLFTRAINKKA